MDARASSESAHGLSAGSVRRTARASGGILSLLVAFGCGSTAGAGAPGDGGADRSEVPDGAGPGSDAAFVAMTEGGAEDDGPTLDTGAGDGASVLGDGSTEAGATVQCGPGANPSFPTFDKQCGGDGDCALVNHTTSCCGTYLIMSIAQAGVPAFRDAEAKCDAQYPACGCASNEVFVEDGAILSSNGGQTSAVMARCESGACRAVDTGPTFACGDQTCANVDYCYAHAHAADASAPVMTYSCVFAGGSVVTSCSGIAISAGCTCAANQGDVTVTCTPACTTCSP